MIHHYTPITCVQSILQQDNIHLWATNYLNLDDPLEFKWAKRFISPKMKKIAEELGCKFDPDFNAYPYTISFCNNPDNLTLWKLYTNWGKGIHLSFDENELEEIGCKHKGYPDVLQTCIYSNENELENKIKAAWCIYRQGYGSNAPMDDLQEVCAFIKNDAYEVEDEIRYCSFNYDIIHFSPKNIEGTETESINEVRFRMRNNEMVAYKDIQFPKTLLKELTIGYSLEFIKTKENLIKLLRANGYDVEKIEIKQSKYQLLPQNF